MNFYCLSPAVRKGFLLSISRFFLDSTRNHLLSPEVGPYPPRYPQGCSQAGGSSLRKLPVVAAYAKQARFRPRGRPSRRRGRLVVSDCRPEVVAVVISAHQRTLRRQHEPALRCRLAGRAV